MEIKNRYTGNVIFSDNSDNMREAAEAAVKAGVSLAEADLVGVDLYGVDLYGVDLYGANLRLALLRGANLRGANLSGANLKGANLRWANLQGANLQGANLWEANLLGANLLGANLRLALLRGANLQRANLSGANLLGANLQGANLQLALLRGANLRGANLRGANLREVEINPALVMASCNWGRLSDELTADLMLWDAANHPNSEAFDAWAAGGGCPYMDNRNTTPGFTWRRACQFQEKRELWGKGQVCRPFDLATRILAEVCPPWTDAQVEEFDKKFGK